MDTSRKPLPRGIYILPNLFTTASLLAGFIGLVRAAQGDVESCALMVLISAVMDGLDGKVARLTGTASEFGIQYDSLADLVAFGVTPAFMVWVWMLQGYGRLGVAVSFLFVACAALRLARFNVSTNLGSKKFFIGLPSPAGGCTLALIVFVSRYVPDMLVPFMPKALMAVTFGVALLMVSRVRYFSFKEFGFLRSHPFRSLVVMMVGIALIYSEPSLFGPLLCLLYVVSGLVYTFIILPTRNRRLLRSLSDNLS